MTLTWLVFYVIFLVKHVTAEEVLIIPFDLDNFCSCRSLSSRLFRTRASQPPLSMSVSTRRLTDSAAVRKEQYISIVLSIEEQDE